MDNKEDEDFGPVILEYVSLWSMHMYLRSEDTPGTTVQEWSNRTLHRQKKTEKEKKKECEFIEGCVGKKGKTLCLWYIMTALKTVIENNIGLVQGFLVGRNVSTKRVQKTA